MCALCVAGLFSLFTGPQGGLRTDLLQLQDTHHIALFRLDDRTISWLQFKNYQMVEYDVVTDPNAIRITGYTLSLKNKLLAASEVDRGLFVRRIGGMGVSWYNDVFPEAMSISNDGKQLAYVGTAKPAGTGGESRGLGVWVLNIDNRKKVQICDDVAGGSSVDWSVDDKELVYTNTQGKIISVLLKDGRRSEHSEGTDASWMPGAARVIAFRSKDSYYTLDVKSKEVKKLVDGAGLHGPVRFSEDGRFGAYQTTSFNVLYGEQANVYVIRMSDLSTSRVYFGSLGVSMPTFWGRNTK